MLARELHPKIAQEPLPHVLLFCPGKAPWNGEPFEPIIAERAVQAIVNHYVDPGMRDLCYTVYYADETSPGEIAQEARTMPFLAERRVILVRNAERYDAMSGEKNSALAPLAEYLEQPNDTTLLLIVAAKADKRKKLYKLVSQLGGIVECPGLSERDVDAWIRDEARQLGKRIDAGATMELAARAGNRLGDVQNALRVVAGYVGQAEAIRVDDVVAACSDVAEETVWTLTDAIAASEMKKALKALHQLIAMGKSPEEIIGIINWMLEGAYKLSPASGENQSPFLTKKFTPLYERLGVALLREAMATCTKTHFSMRTTGVDRDLALELLVIRLAAKRGPTARKPAA